MNLPDGVSYHRRRRKCWTNLTSKGGDGLIRIDDQPPYDNNSAYEIEDRTFTKAIAPYLKGDWKDFDRLFGLEDLKLKDPAEKMNLTPRQVEVLASRVAAQGLPGRPLPRSLASRQEPCVPTFAIFTESLGFSAVPRRFGRHRSWGCATAAVRCVVRAKGKA